MYLIKENDNTIALVDSLRFIRQSESGCFVEATEGTAQGIVLNGNPFNLLGRKVMDEELPIVWYSKVDGGEYILYQQAEIDEIILTLLEA